MTTTSFTIVSSIILFGSLLMLVLSLKFEPTIKAGKANKFRFRFALSPYGYGSCKQVICGDKVVNIDGLETFRPKGRSMSYNGIESNQRVYVQPFSSLESKNNITTHPVVVLTMTDVGFLDSHYKLRKFIDYVVPQTANWKEIYKKHHVENRIKITLSDFEKSMTKKSETKEVKTAANCVLSETLNETTREFEYSLHPVNSLYGKVMFVE